VNVGQPSTDVTLRAMVAAIDDGLRGNPGPAMPWPVLIRLLELVGGESLIFNELDLRTRRGQVQQKVVAGGQCLLDPDDNQQRLGPYWAHRRNFRPNAYQERTGDLARILILSDFYTDRELRAEPLYAEYYRGYGVRHCLMVGMPAPPGYCRRLVFWRAPGPDFTERDRLMLQLLRPHLFDVYLDAERRRRQIPGLTTRQREVLHLAALGYGNADIASALFVSVATVRKHMENIFDRTGVRNRSAAVALVLPQLARHQPATDGRPIDQPPQPLRCAQSSGQVQDQ
jgi:DNA-binding CsgD family transcriptional regulator